MGTAPSWRPAPRGAALAAMVSLPKAHPSILRSPPWQMLVRRARCVAGPGWAWDVRDALAKGSFPAGETQVQPRGVWGGRMLHLGMARMLLSLSNSLAAPLRTLPSLLCHTDPQEHVAADGGAFWGG